jgi:hypothetical protein
MYSSYFGSNSTPLSFNTTDAFSSKLNLSSGTSGGGSGMLPAIAGGLISGATGLVGGIFGNRQQANIANAQLAAQADQLKQGILFQRDAAKANMGLGIFGQVFGSTTAPDLEFGRQTAAQRLQFGEFIPKQLGLGREEARWQAAFENSADMKEKSRRERVGRLQESIATLRATPTGMFGRIAQAPIESLMV